MCKTVKQALGEIKGGNDAYSEDQHMGRDFLGGTNEGRVPLSGVFTAAGLVLGPVRAPQIPSKWICEEAAFKVNQRGEKPRQEDGEMDEEIATLM